jgi:hypothetical protein
MISKKQFLLCALITSAITQEALPFITQMQLRICTLTAYALFYKYFSYGSIRKNIYHPIITGAIIASPAYYFLNHKTSEYKIECANAIIGEAKQKNAVISEESKSEQEILNHLRGMYNSEDTWLIQAQHDLYAMRDKLIQALYYLSQVKISESKNADLVEKCNAQTEVGKKLLSNTVQVIATIDKAVARNIWS